MVVPCTPSRRPISASETSCSRHRRAAASCALPSFAGLPRSRTSPAEPSSRARERSIDTYTGVSPITAATSLPANPSWVSITTAMFRIPASAAG
jgi:hypothetical protein